MGSFSQDNRSDADQPNPPNVGNQDHPLAQALEGVELTGRGFAGAPTHPDTTLPAPRAPLQFAPPPPPPPPPPASLQPTIPPPLTESPTRTLDEFVDYLLSSGGDDGDADSSPRRLHPEPLPSDTSDVDRLKRLVARRAYADVVVLTHHLLTGSSSHYAPIWQGLLNGESSGNLALESQQQELLQIVMVHMQGMLKLKRYNELGTEIKSWAFAHSNRSSDDNTMSPPDHGCPSWVPWSFHIAVANCLQYTVAEANNSNEPLDALYNIRADIASDDYANLIRIDQVICNICSRQKQWRMALVALQNILQVLRAAAKQQGSSSDDDAQAALEIAYTCQVLGRQGRTLLQAGATAAASNIFERASSLWNSTTWESTQKLAAAIAIVPAQLALNEGLAAFADTKYEHALECFRRAAQQVKPLCQESSFAEGFGFWSIDTTALVTDSPLVIYSECINNMALCAIYTCRLHESIHLMESLVRENPTAFLTERVALNLCTLYELQCDSAVAARKKRVLQLLAKRFTLQDIGAECFRLQP